MSKGIVWTPHRWDRAQRLRANGHSDGEIAIALNLTERQIRCKFANERHSTKRHLVARVAIAPLYAERDRAYGSTRTLTEILCGDPPAGRSALSQKNGHHPS